jgi:hypothetical protein
VRSSRGAAYMQRDWRRNKNRVGRIFIWGAVGGVNVVVFGAAGDGVDRRLPSKQDAAPRYP